MIEIIYEENKNRVAAYDDGKEIGELTYSLSESEDIWEANHTYVNPDYRGQNIAGRLLEALVEAAREKDVKIKALCSYVVRMFELKNEEFEDVIQE